MYEVHVQLLNGNVECGYAGSLKEAVQKVLGFYKALSVATFQEIPMTAMRQGRENLGCFARKQAMEGDK